VGGCVLECKRCKANVSHTNPSQAAQRHKFIAAALAAAGMRSSPQKHSPMGRKTPSDFPAALKKHAVSALPDRRSKHHTSAHVAAFVLVHPPTSSLKG